MSTTIDRKTLNRLATEITDALQEVAERNGITINAGGGTYGNTHGVLKLELATIADDGQVLTRAASDFLRYCESYGWRPDQLGSIVTWGKDSTQYRITGLAERSRKYPLTVERVSDGKGFKLPKSALKPHTSAAA